MRIINAELTFSVRQKFEVLRPCFVSTCFSFSNRQWSFNYHFENLTRICTATRTVQMEVLFGPCTGVTYPCITVYPFDC